MKTSNLKSFLKIVTSILLVASFAEAEIKKFRIGQCFSFNDLAIADLKKNGADLHPLEELFFRSMIFSVKSEVYGRKGEYKVDLVHSMEPISPRTAQLYMLFKNSPNLVQNGGGLLFDSVSCGRTKGVEKNLKKPGEVTDAD